MIVDLTRQEMLAGAITGSMRHIEAVKRNLPDLYGFDGQSGWSTHIEGACGEIAAAKAFGIYWSPTVNTFGSAPDIMPNIQVRTRSKHDYDLIVRPADKPDDVFVLVTGLAPSFFICGWLKAKDAQQDKWWKTYGGRPGAWFVPQNELHHIDSFH